MVLISLQRNPGARAQQVRAGGAAPRRGREGIDGNGQGGSTLPKEGHGANGPRDPHPHWGAQETVGWGADVRGAVKVTASHRLGHTRNLRLYVQQNPQ